MTQTSPYRAMRDLVSAESDAGLVPVQGCTSPDHDERFVLTDRRTGRPIVDARYRIDGPDLLIEGRTDELGRTQRVHTAGKARRLVVHQVEEPLTLSGDRSEGDGCL